MSVERLQSGRDGQSGDSVPYIQKALSIFEHTDLKYELIVSAVIGVNAWVVWQFGHNNK